MDNNEKLEKIIGQLYNINNSIFTLLERTENQNEKIMEIKENSKNNMINLDKRLVILERRTLKSENLLKWAYISTLFVFPSIIFFILKVNYMI